MTSRQKQAQATRERLIRSAMELFSCDSYENVKVSDICQRAGTSVGVFYHYFKNKESVIDGIYDVSVGHLQERWDVKDFATPREAIVDLAKSRLELCEQVGPIVASQDMKLLLHNPGGKVLRDDRFYIKTIKKLVWQEVEDDTLFGDADLIAKHLIMMNRGVIVEWCIDNGAFDIIAVGVQVLDYLLEYYSQKREERAESPTGGPAVGTMSPGR